jgi:sulfate transport system ATP-binding protein
LLHTGDSILPVIGNGHETAGDAVAYVRPHDLDLERYAPGADGIAVTLRRALTLGPVAQLELEREDTQEVIEVALPLERFRHQGFREGELLAVRPRQLRVFVQPHSAIPVPTSEQAQSQARAHVAPAGAAS